MYNNYLYLCSISIRDRITTYINGNDIKDDANIYRIHGNRDHTDRSGRTSKLRIEPILTIIMEIIPHEPRFSLFILLRNRIYELIDDTLFICCYFVMH